MIELPDTNGLSTGRAAKAYVGAGIPLVVFDPAKGNGKACWNLLHYRMVTTDSTVIDSWRKNFGPFRHLGLATSPGAFGAIVLDVDRPDEFPRQWRSLLETVPFVATRPKEHRRRGHYYFSLPVGLPPVGNSAHGWGEVRCLGGGIVLPPYPTDDRHVVRSGRLPEIPADLLDLVAGMPGVEIEPVSIEDFCARYSDQKYRDKLKGLKGIHRRRLTRNNEHDAMMHALLTGLTEARLGFVPAKAVLDTLRPLWGKRSPGEFRRLAVWTATKVEAMTAEELKTAEAKSRRDKGSDSREYAAKFA